jgi:hypothetical protein
LHALPYEVVVLELLAPEYSGGLDLYLQIQNQSGALRVDALSNMATPPTYAILIQHLHVIYDVLLLTLVIGVFLHPRGVRTQHTDIWRGTQWTTQLLHGHEERLGNVTRMRPEVFRKLLDWMQEYGDLKDSKLLSAVEKLLIFLFIFSSNASYRMACELTQHASSTIHEFVLTYLLFFIY